MAKAEMEDHRAQYDALLSRALKALQSDDYGRAKELAISCWQHIDGMMQYERKYGDQDRISIDAIEIALRIAPLFFDYGCLDTLKTLLKNQRRIEKNSAENLSDKLAIAQTLMWNAHRLWNHLELHPNSRQDELHKVLGADQSDWPLLAEKWEVMGVVRRSPEGKSYRLALAKPMSETTLAKCPSCAAIAKAPKANFLENHHCPKCHDVVSFVIMSPAISSSM
jgi:hypothetical protein